MRAYHIELGAGAHELVLRSRPDPQPGDHEVVVRVRAASLNSRDLKILHGRFRIKPRHALVPLSDGAGEVVRVGSRVTRFRVGDRVAGSFHQRWLGGRLSREAMGSDLGGSLDGMLAEQVVLDEQGLVPIPSGLSFEEASTLPCAAVTAWGALRDGVPLAPGDTVLTLGSGGVSLFALQFAKLQGARVISTTSNPDKVGKLEALGADEIVLLSEAPDWEARVLALTGGRGVDHVVEVGGPRTLAKSLKSTALGGQVVLVGILGGSGEGFDPETLRGRNITVRSTNVGSRQSFEAMNRAIEVSRLRPVIDSIFPFEHAREAFDHLASQRHFGKVVIACP